MYDLPTPCHIFDMDRLEENLMRIRQLKQLSGCKVLLAVKGFSAPYLFPPMQKVLDGVSASGLYEARLGREQFGGYIQTYSPAFRKKDIPKIIEYSDAVIFNSANQLELFGRDVRKAGCMCGIRINPMRSYIWKEDADPCKQHSRLGIPIDNITTELLASVDGIHIHAMCEQQANALEALATLLDQKLGLLLKDAPHIKWINLGGGQLIGQDDYEITKAADILRKVHESYDVDVIIEPCEGVVTQCGFFAAQVCDIVNNEEKTAILDASPVCHMTDAVFRGWRHDVSDEAENGKGFGYYLSGPTCFAGDTFGYYTFSKPLKVGDILYFKDTAAYTWVKNNTFNGIPTPTICTYSKAGGLHIEKEPTYDQYFKSL